MNILKNTVLIFSLIIIGALTSCNSGKQVVEVVSSEKLEGGEFKPVELKGYTIGPGDVIDVSVWNDDGLNRKVQIDPDGKFIYPFVGEVKANGLALIDVHKLLETGLSEYFITPKLSVSISKISSQKIYVVGEVSLPGVYALNAQVNVLEAIMMAGGESNDAKLAKVVVIRGDRKNPTLIKVNLKSALKEASLSQNIMLSPGDIVYVPSSLASDIGRIASHIGRVINPIVMFEQGLRLGPRVVESY